MTDIISRLKQTLIDFKYGRLVFIVAIIFSLLYHASFLGLFGVLGIYQLYYFNFFSNTLFLVVTIIAPRLKSLVVPYAFCFAEVVTHQLMAFYYVGGEAEFQFFILLIGLLPLLCFNGKFKLALSYGFFSYVLFIALEALSPFIRPRYDVSDTLIHIFGVVNKGLVASVILGCLGLYAYVLFFYEENLEKQVKEKRMKSQRRTVSSRSFIPHRASES